MKKRLRKKHRLGEFQEFGFDLQLTLAPGLDDRAIEDFLDSFLLEAIEAHGLLAGGGFLAGFFVVAEARRASATEAHREAVRQWLASRREVQAFRVSALRDAHRDLAPTRPVRPRVC